MKNNVDLLWPANNYFDFEIFKALNLNRFEVETTWELTAILLAKMSCKITKSKISPLASISPSAIIEGPVVIEAGAKIMENVKISGPAYIGKEVIIGNCSLIRESFISENSVIGYLVDIARSYVGKSCWFSRVHIADSLLCNEVSIGGDTVVASLRLDNLPVMVKFSGEKITTGKIKFGAVVGGKTQIGANSTIMPGTIIGKNCIVGAGSILSQNLEDNTYCHVDQKLILRPNINTYSSKARNRFKKILISNHRKFPRKSQNSKKKDSTTL